MRVVITLTLLTACTWLVGNIMLGAFIAPELFSHSPADITRAQAGQLFGDLLAHWIHIVDLSLWLALLVLLSLCAGYHLKLQHRLRMGMMLFVMLTLSGIHLWARSTVDDAHAQRPALLESSELQVLPNEQHAAFARLHQRSEILFATETLLLALIVCASAVAIIAPRSDADGTPA